jgi:hypothetical protein
MTDDWKASLLIAGVVAFSMSIGWAIGFYQAWRSITALKGKL